MVVRRRPVRRRASLLVGGGQIEHGVVQFAAARHDFVLEEFELGLVGNVNQGIRDGVGDVPEFSQAPPQFGDGGAAAGILIQRLQRAVVFGLQGVELIVELDGLGRCGDDHEVADIVAGLPEIEAKHAERLVLLGVVPVDDQVLRRKAVLNAPRFECGEYEYGDDSNVTGSQNSMLTKPHRHGIFIVSPQV
jgi:hypothetical protein